jgi:hypothetical protein
MSSREAALGNCNLRRRLVPSAIEEQYGSMKAQADICRRASRQLSRRYAFAYTGENNVHFDDEQKQSPMGEG